MFDGHVCQLLHRAPRVPPRPPAEPALLATESVPTLFKAQRSKRESSTLQAGQAL